jgi:hypothetical protein
MSPTGVFEDVDIEELCAIADAILREPLDRHGMIEGTLTARIPLLPVDSSPIGAPISQRLQFKPRALHHSNVQSNQGLFYLLESHIAEADPRRFRMLLVDVGIFDRTIKVVDAPDLPIDRQVFCRR